MNKQETYRRLNEDIPLSSSQRNDISARTNQVLMPASKVRLAQRNDQGPTTHVTM